MNFTYWLCLGYAFGIWTLSKRGTIQATGDQGFVLWPEYCLSQEGVINMKAIHNFVFCVEELKVFQHPVATKEHNEMCWVLLSGPSMALHLQWFSVLYGFLQWCFEGRIAADAFFLQKAEEGWTCGRDVLFCSQEHHLQWWQGREITVLSLALHPGSSPSIHISFLGLLNPDNNAWNYLPHLLCCARSISSFKNFFKAKSFWLPALTPPFFSQRTRQETGGGWMLGSRG